MSQNGTLSTKQARAALGLASGQTIPALSMTVTVSPRTLYRWQKLAPFQQELARLQHERELKELKTFDSQLALLKTGFITALTTLERNMRSDVRPSVQVRAATTWIEQAMLIHKIQQVEARMDELTALMEKL